MIFGISILFEYVPIFVGWVVFCDWLFVNEVYKGIAIILYALYLLNKRAQLDSVAHNVSLAKTSGFYPEGLNTQLKIVELNFVVDLWLCVLGYITLVKSLFF